MIMAEYRFQFETGNLQHGLEEIKIKDFVAKVEGETSEGLALLIKAHGGQLVKENPKAKTKRKRKVNPVKWAGEAGEK